MRYVFGDCPLDTEIYVVQRTGLTIPLRLKVFQVLHDSGAIATMWSPNRSCRSRCGPTNASAMLRWKAS
jgi:hypothetical protein